MYSAKAKDVGKDKRSKKEKKLFELINTCSSDTDNENEHELSYYIHDRVKLMKEVLKVIKPKKIIGMAPECMRDMDKDEINSILLEELLGISNKRLKYIFEGKNLEEESSSSDEDQPVDVISLDDVSDDDFVIISDEEEKIKTKLPKRKKIKEEHREKYKKIKTEKASKDTEVDKYKSGKRHKEKNLPAIKEPMGEENLMSVLELLELQARARAIRSQLELESKKKKEDQEKQQEVNKTDQDDDDEIIIEVPKEEEIVITSSDSENEDTKEKATTEGNESENHLSNQEDDSVNSFSNWDKADQSVVVDLKNTPVINNIEENVNDSSSRIQMDNSIIQNKENVVSESTDKLETVQKSIDENVPECDGSANLKETSSDSTNNSKKDENTASTTCSDKPEELEQIDIDTDEVHNSEKEKHSKEKKLRHLKNKLESYKRDIAVESNVKVLENIVIIQKTVTNNKSHEESDDLVINVDQADLDCIICD